MTTGPRLGFAAPLAALLLAGGLLVGERAASAPADYEFVLIASENDPGFVANGFLDIAINDLGQVAYTRARDVNSPSFAYGGAVLIGDGATTATIVDGSTPVPPGFFVTFLNLNDPGSARFQRVVLNNSGQVAFQADLNNRAVPFRLGDTGVGMYATDIDGNLVEIGVGDNDCCGPEPEFSEVGEVAINDRGVVALAAREQTPGDANGQPVLVLTRSTHDPAGSSAVALEEYDDSVFVPELGRQVGTRIQLDPVCDIDDAGSVVASGYYSFVPEVGDPIQGGSLFTGPAAPPAALVIGGGAPNEFYISSSNVDPRIGNGGLVTFLAGPFGMNTSLYGVDRMETVATLLAPATAPIDQIGSHDANDLGDVVFVAFTDSFANTGAYTGTDLALDRVLASGDAVLGHSIDDVYEARINDHGQVALRVRFADDGAEAIVRADPVGLPDRPCTPSLPGVLDGDCLPTNWAELEAGSPVTIQLPVLLDGDETALTFALRFPGTEGEVSLMLEGANPTVIYANGQPEGAFVQRVVQLPAPVSGSYDLAFTFDGPTGALAEIADVQLLVGADTDPIAGGHFVDAQGDPFASLAEAGWTVSGDGSAVLRSVPEPASGALAACAALLVLGARRARVRGSRADTGS